MMWCDASYFIFSVSNFNFFFILSDEWVLLYIYLWLWMLFVYICVHNKVDSIFSSFFFFILSSWKIEENERKCITWHYTLFCPYQYSLFVSNIPNGLKIVCHTQFSSCSVFSLFFFVLLLLYSFIRLHFVVTACLFFHFVFIYIKQQVTVKIKKEKRTSAMAPRCRFTL